VVLARQLAIGGFDIVGRRGSLNAEGFIVVLKFHTGSFLLAQPIMSACL
jgi:hypothetical protein